MAPILASQRESTVHPFIIIHTNWTGSGIFDFSGVWSTERLSSMGSPGAMPVQFTRKQRYYAFSKFLKERFGTKVYRVTIDAGFTCPNVDGTVAVGGCVFCDNRSFSPNRRLPRSTVKEQVQRGITILTKRYGTEQFIAYFQAATNTYALPAKLKRLYDEALEHPQIVGLAIGTRPDCV